MTERESLSNDRPTWRYRCEFPGDAHDEVFPCEVCERLVCGCCADAGNGAEWFCPDCAPLVEQECKSSLFNNAERCREAGARVLFAFTMQERGVPQNTWNEATEEQREEWRKCWDTLVAQANDDA